MRKKTLLLLTAVAIAAMVAATVAGAVDERGPRARSIAPLLPPTALQPLVQRSQPKPPPKPAGFTVEQVKSGAAVPLHAKPGGPVVARAWSRTQFGSPQTLTVADRVGGWLGVINENVENGSMAWIKARTPGLKTKRTQVALRVNLARKQLQLLDGNHVERSIKVGVGQPGSPTPKGRFSVTDKLAGSQYGAAYGCCILALSGTQPHPPAGWHGGDRLAIHGTDNPGTIGRGSSAGCLHAGTRDMELLMRKVGLGTPVFIH